MNRIPFAWLPRLSLVLALGWLAGCAVVTVDVDVYKGPLANTEEIQGDQVVSLAMGAKPLLVQLRDFLEASEPRPVRYPDGMTSPRRPASGRTLEDQLRELRNSPDYRAGFIIPALGSGQKSRDAVRGHVFQSELALRVNDVLGLYEDTAEASIAATIQEAREWLLSYQLNLSVLEPESNAEMQKWWEQVIQPALSTSTDAATRNLASAYRDFLLHTRASDRTRSTAGMLFSGAPTYGTNLTTNNLVYSYGLLRDRLVVDHANTLLTGTNSPRARAEFIEATKRICDAYLDSAQDLRGLLRLALFNLSQVRTMNNLPEATRIAIGEELSVAIAQLLHAPALKVALNQHADKHVALGDVKKALFGSAPEPSRPRQLEFSFSDPNPITEENLQRDRWYGLDLKTKKDWRTRLGRLLAEDERGALSAALLEVDQLLATDSISSTIKEWASFSVGLATDPVSFQHDFGKAPTPANLFGDTLQSLGRHTGPLDGGRLQNGLEALIHKYLVTVEVRQDFGQRIESEEGQRLISALAQFGQKVVSLGNMAPLMSSSVASSEVKRYVAVLQGVGNSILVHLDELKQSARHKERLARRSSIVAKALQEEVGHSLKGSALRGWDSRKHDAREAAEQLVTELRAEYIRLLREAGQGPGGEAKLGLATGLTVTDGRAAASRIAAGHTNSLVLEVHSTGTQTNATATLVEGAEGPRGLALYREALERAIEMRAGMIQLRPASSYLRSSYPASVLQRNTISQGNLLSYQALRGIPLAGGLFDGFKNADVRTFRELDQQAWQNVNRVRVSGAGDINYAIAKDDVGNWYVKTYATKPDRIINSMRNLAAFSAGTSLGQALPIRGASGTVLATTNASLQRQFSTALAGYHAASTNEYLRLHRALAGFPTAIPAAWAKANGIKSDGAEFASLTNSLSSAWSEEIGGALDASKKAWDQALNEKKDVATLGSFAEAEIPELLRKGLTAFARIQQGIQGTSQPKDGKAAASQELVRLVQPVLRRAVADRNAAFDQLQAALRVIKSGAE